MGTSRVYTEIEKLSINPSQAKQAALDAIEQMETNKTIFKKVRFNPLEWRIQLAFIWDQTEPNLQKLWPQLSQIQTVNRSKSIKI